MNHDQIQELVGDFDLLSEDTDDAGREIVTVEIRGAQRRVLVEDLNGEIKVYSEGVQRLRA